MTITASVDEQAARKILDDLQTTSTGCNWYEIRALMETFDIPRFTDAARARLTSALAAVGVELDPPLAELTRQDNVVLSVRGSGVPVEKRSLRAVDETVHARVARAGEPLRVVSLAEAASTDAVRWYDIQRPSEVAAHDVLTALGPACPGLTLAIVEDALSRDPRPKVKTFDRGRVRALATFRAGTEESDAGVDAESKSKAGVVRFDPVELFVGEGWLLSTWHETEVFRGAIRIEECASEPGEEIYDAIARSWLEHPLSSAGDLAALLLFELTATYKPACRQLRIWEEEWELDFYRTNHVDDETLVETQASMALLRDWIVPLNMAGLRKDVNRAWFPGITGAPERGGYERALRADDQIDRALIELRELNTTLRGDYELLHLRQLELDRERDDRFQRTVAIGGSAILIPSLVAGVMGVNTWVPGEYGPGSAKWAFIALLALVLASGIAAWYLLRRLHNPKE